MSALWGRGGKSVVWLAALAVALSASSVAAAGSNPGPGGSTTTTTTATTTSTSGSSVAFMTKSLAGASKANPSAVFQVIVKGKKGVKTSDVASAVGATKRQWSVINGVSAQLTGSQIQTLAKSSKIGAIVQDDGVVRTALSNLQLWPAVAGLSGLWGVSLASPAIAVVDSGVDAARAADFGARVIAQQSFVPVGHSNAAADGFGHGTFVASIAAGQADLYTGAAPGANVVSLDVFDDSGAGAVSDVIQAADWIYRNKDRYGIRVANFSLTGSQNSSFMYDPLDQAIEKLWFSGVVVVTAAGNFNGVVSGVPYAPANDPFAITVGAADVSGTLGTSDDFAAPWSSYGYTLDGFMKPEVAAPGRYMNGAVPATASMYLQHPERVVAPGYMWMSGTSFAAPVVAGAAAQILAAHPTWTPDQVKGALMLAAQPYSGAAAYTLGVGEITAVAASAVVNPPNPNQALDQYVVPDSNGGLAFDAASWSSAAQANASWSSASWSSASWSSASWSSASWSSASWSSASWSSASWSSGQTQDGGLPAASWSSATWVS